MSSAEDNVRRRKKRDQELLKRMKNLSKEEMAAAVVRKKECNARAMLIVEKLIEPNVEQLWFLENLKHINQCHFQDIVEERAITRCCGYPLCDEELTNVPKKLYKISTKDNKVYDLTDRKNYCSNMCYKAGTFLKDQLYTSPLWLRDCETSVDYKILTRSKESQGTGAGAEIDLGNTHPVKLEKAENEVVTQKEQDISDNKCENKILRHKIPVLKIATENNEVKKLEDAEHTSNNLSLKNKGNIAQRNLKPLVSDSYPGNMNTESKNIDSHCSKSTEPLRNSVSICESHSKETSNLKIQSLPYLISDEVLSEVKGSLKNEIVADNTPNLNDLKESCKSNELKQACENINFADSSTNYENLSDLPEDHATSGVAVDSSTLKSSKYEVDVSFPTVISKTNNKNYEECAANEKEPCIAPLNTNISNYTVNNQILKSHSSDKSNHGEQPLRTAISVSDKSNLQMEAISHDHAFKNADEDNFNSILNKCQDDNNCKASVLHGSVLDQNISTEVGEDKSNIACNTVHDSTSNVNTDDNMKDKPNKSKKTSLNKYQSKIETALTCVIRDLEQKIESWFTLETMVYLLGQERLRELLKMSGFKEDFSLPKSSKKEDYLTYQKCQEIYKKLNLLELKEKEKQIPSKPVPDFKSLQDETEDLELKVNAFYRGDKQVTFSENVNDTYNFCEDDLPVLPLIDHLSVISLRRRIFIERLNKVLPDMLSVLELTHFRIGCELQELISTFNLDATNIPLRPPEWTLVAVVLMKLLTLNNEILNFAYSKEVTQRRLITYLLFYDLDGGYIDRFTSYLLDIERLADTIHVE